MDPDDDEISSFQPPPDPSQREWRHPAEMAAGRSAFSGSDSGLSGASQTGAPTSSRLGLRQGQPWPRMMGAAAVLGLVLGGFVVVSRPDSVDLDAGITLPTYLEGEISAISSTSVAANAPRQLSAPGLKTLTTKPHGELVATTPQSTTTTSTAPANDQWANGAGTTWLSSTGSTQPHEIDYTDLTLSAAGVLQLYSVADQGPVASGIIVEGLILSSASALHGHEEVSAFDGQTWMTLKVIATDPHTDVAVLGTSEELNHLTPVVTAPEGPSTAPGQVVALLDAHRTESPDSGMPAEAVCEVVTTTNRAVTAHGYEVMGALSTTCRRTDVFGGAALVDHQGRVVGVLVNSTDQLASALPLDIAVQVGRSLVEEGWRGGAWLGIHGQAMEDGFLLDEVDPTGPAALAGLQTGDLITQINNQSLAELSELLHMLRELGIGDPIEVALTRVDQQTGELVAITLEIEFTTKLVTG